jgi:hypothetical protein
MKRIIYLFLCVEPFLYCSGQEPDTIDLTIPIDYSAEIYKHKRIPGNSVYIELAGHLNVVSINYEKVFYKVRDFYLTGRVGLGYIPPTVNTLTVPVLANGIYRVSDVLFLELGFGLSVTYTFWSDITTREEPYTLSTVPVSGHFMDILLAGHAGIRVQKKNGFLFRFGFTPLYELTDILENRTVYMQLDITEAFLPWVGMSFGYSF